MDKHVLIVEDDTDLRNYLCLCLANAGITTYPAASAEEALTHLGRVPSFHFGVFDIDLPGISGTDLLKRLEQIPQYKDLCPIITTGSLVLPKVSYHGKPCPVLSKPYDMTVIMGFMNVTFPEKINLSLVDLR